MNGTKGLRWAFVTCLLVVAAGCGGYDAPQAAPQAVEDTTLEQLQDELTNSCTTTTNCNNCVYYASCRQPKLPSGLGTYAGKVAIINRYSNPFPGCVAVINTGNEWGHVAFVEYYNTNGTVYISEGNWPWGQCGSRSGTASQLNITGYWCP